MYKKKLLFLIILIFDCCTAKRIGIDGIVAIRAGESGVFPIYYSDAWFPSPIGMPQSIEDRIIKANWLSHGQEHGIKSINDGSSREYAEQYMDMLQEQKGVSRDKLAEMSSHAGYSLKDIKNELNEQYLLQQTIETTLAANGSLNISSEEIDKYYKEHPKIESGVVTIKKGILNNINIKDFLNNNYDEKDIIWDEPIKINSAEISEDFIEAKTAKEGSNIKVIDNKEEIIIYRLINKTKDRLLTLSEQYEEIMKTIQQEKYIKAYKEITKNIIESSYMIYFDSTFKEKCIEKINGML